MCGLGGGPAHTGTALVTVWDHEWEDKRAGWAYLSRHSTVQPRSPGVGVLKSNLAFWVIF